MRLLKLTLNNFQGIKALTLDFPNGCSASIYGDNATGKTTVYNALTWLLFDKASTGAKGFSPKTMGQNGELHHLDHEVEAIFRADSGKIFTLKKVFKEQYKRKRGTATEEFSGHITDYFVDAVPVQQKEYNAAVLNYCGGNNEHIKMLTMFDYFPEQMKWEDRRKVLIEICGDISDAEVIDSSKDLAELKSYLLIPGTDDDYYSTEEYRKIAGAKCREINKQLEALPARIDEALRSVSDVSGLDGKEIDKTIDKLTAEKEALMNKVSGLNAGAKKTELNNLIAEINAEIAEKQNSYGAAEAEYNRKASEKADKIRAEISNVKWQLSDAETESRKYKIQLSDMAERRAQIIADIQKLRAEVFDESKGICPTCGQRLPEDKITEMRDEYNLRKSERLERLNKQGREQASKEMIAEVEANMKAADNRALGYRANLDKLTEELDTIKLKDIPSYTDTPDYAENICKIEGFRKQIAEVDKSIDDDKRTLKEAINGLTEQIGNEYAKLQRIAIADAQNERVKELEAEEETLAAEYEEFEKGLYLAELFVKTKMQMISEKVNGRFKSVKFRLFQDQINGGIKDDCEVMIPCEGGRMVPYTFANNAAKINAGLEIIDTLSEAWELAMPLFVDNAESVTRLNAGKNMQIIRLVVSEPDKKLRLELDQ